MTRVSAEASAAQDHFAGLCRLGVDEISYKRGHRYLLVVVDHDSGRLVLAAAGREAVVRCGTRLDAAVSTPSHASSSAASLRHGLSNARIESINTKLCLLTRLAFGFHSSDALVALALLSLGGLCPPLPGRS